MNKSPLPLESLEEWPKPIKMTEPYVVDFNIFEGARPVFNTKYFSIDHAESLSDAIQSVFKERSDGMLMENNNPDTTQEQLVLGMIARITSVICVGKTTELRKFLQVNNFPLR